MPYASATTRRSGCPPGQNMNGNTSAKGYDTVLIKVQLSTSGSRAIALFLGPPDQVDSGKERESWAPLGIVATRVNFGVCGSPSLSQLRQCVGHLISDL
jgi:hypothetical protein